MFGDAASITHYNVFIKELWKKPVSTLEATSPDAKIVRYALSRFHAFPTNWHHGLNQMCEHYARFYGIFLQPV